MIFLQIVHWRNEVAIIILSPYSDSKVDLLPKNRASLHIASSKEIKKFKGAFSHTLHQCCALQLSRWGRGARESTVNLGSWHDTKTSTSYARTPFVVLNRITVCHLLLVNTEKPYHIKMEKWITFSVDYALLIGMKNLSSSLLFIKCFLHQQAFHFLGFTKRLVWTGEALWCGHGAGRESFSFSSHSAPICFSL